MFACVPLNLSNWHLSATQSNTIDLQMVFIIIVVAIISIAILYGVLCHKRKSSFDVWTSVAKVTGFKMQNPEYSPEHEDISMTGIFDGCRISVYEETRGSGTSKTTHTIIEGYTNNSFRYTLDIRSQTWFDSIDQIFGEDDIEISDSEFDKNYVIKSNNPQFVQQILTGKLRKLILDELKDLRLSLKDRTLKYEIQGLEGNGEKLLTAISVIAKLCKNIDSAQ